ncbi:MAG: hypothetical protein ACOCXH_08300 [Cyclobacteriaceae bacterium]
MQIEQLIGWGAIEIGVVLSAILFMKRIPDVSEKRIDHVVDNNIIENYSDFPAELNVYEISGLLFFASARRYTETIEEIGINGKKLIIIVKYVSFID